MEEEEWKIINNKNRERSRFNNDVREKAGKTEKWKFAKERLKQRSRREYKSNAIKRMEEKD